MSQSECSQTEGILSDSLLEKILSLRVRSAFLFYSALHQIGWGPATLKGESALLSLPIERLTSPNHNNT